MFLEPELREFVGDWKEIAYSAVARLRALAGAGAGDPRPSEGPIATPDGSPAGGGGAQTVAARLVHSISS